MNSLDIRIIECPLSLISRQKVSSVIEYMGGRIIRNQRMSVGNVKLTDSVRNT